MDQVEVLTVGMSCPQGGLHSCVQHTLLLVINVQRLVSYRSQRWFPQEGVILGRSPCVTWSTRQEHFHAGNPKHVLHGHPLDKIQRVKKKNRKEMLGLQVTRFLDALVST